MIVYIVRFLLAFFVVGVGACLFSMIVCIWIMAMLDMYNDVRYSEPDLHIAAMVGFIAWGIAIVAYMIYGQPQTKDEL